jgi:hypothetical protein
MAVAAEERNCMSMKLAGAFLVIFMFGLATAHGQQKGQYILGTNGLNAGIQPGPGFSYSNQGTIYSADRLKGPDGVTVPVSGTFDLNLDQNFFIYTSKYKFLGGTIGGFFDLVIANSSVVAPQIGFNAGGAGITDTFVQPINLGYHFSRADFTVGFGFVAPTGRYTRNPFSNNNLGSGYWGYLPNVGGTIYLTKDKATFISVFSAYEFHGKKRYTNITPGQTANFEWGFGQSLPIHKNFLQIGAVGYGQWQTSETTGSVPNVVRDSRYAVGAIGPQGSFIVPKWNLSLFVRYQPEFAASARIEGTTWTVGGNISFPVTK